MRAASVGFAAAVGGSHIIATRVDALLGGDIITEDLPLYSGYVEYDRRRAHFANARLTFVDTVNLPTDPTSPLSPFGYELRVWRGIQMPAGPELVALGTFPVQVGAGGDLGDITVDLEDRSRTVADDILETPVDIAAGTNYVDAILALAPTGYADEAVTGSTTLTTPKLHYRAGTNRWTSMQALGVAAGMEVRYDGLGRLTILPEPDLTDDPVAELHEDTNTTAAQQAADRRNSINRVTIVGRNANNTESYVGIATDTQSSAAYDSDFGRKQLREEMAEVGSNAAAQAAANARLNQRKGVTLTVQAAAVPDPRREASDVVALTVSRLNISNTPHIIETLRLDLGPDIADSMTLRGSAATIDTPTETIPVGFDGGTFAAQGTDSFDGGTFSTQGSDSIDGGSL